MLTLSMIRPNSEKVISKLQRQTRWELQWRTNQFTYQ